MINWSIPSVEGRVIVGTTHEPTTGPERGQVIIAHGFKGYKEYGFFPWLAQAMANAGFAAHRFNFSCSGMDHGHGDFDVVAFEQDTWNRQVEDLLSVLKEARAGSLPGRGGPMVLMGHSRGGVASLLAAGRHAGSDELDALRGIMTLASPDTCLSMADDVQSTLCVEGTIPSPSSRTSQVLRVGRAFLEEQRADPPAHDLLLQVSRIKLPTCIVHGTADDAVDVQAATSIANATTSQCEVHHIEGSNHVFNTTNPFPADGVPSEALGELGSIASSFASELSLG
ncbi:MAG: alpha/beta hydrolase [Phycisphaerales bacterium]|nr:alpha/beta hydrolase [Phycisphaerales bacterium]